MSNSYTTAKSCASPSATHSEDSDTQKQEKTQNTYEYLLNELKMKSTALAKASNLIEILQVELEVEKNSKKEAIQAAQENVRRVYNMEITNLNTKIDNLQQALDKKKASFVMNTEVTACETLPRQQSRLLRRSCSKSLNRSVSKQHLSTKQKSNKQIINGENSLQAKMFRKMLLINSKWEGQFIEHFQEITRLETEQIQLIIRNLEQFDEEFEQTFSQNTTKNYQIFRKLEQFQSLIVQQNEIISQMKIYQSQLQDIIKSSTQKIAELTQQKIIMNSRNWSETQIKQTIKQIVSVLNRWKINNKNREKRMEEQNKQLRDIIQQMILLINKKKQSSTKSCGYRVS